MEQFLYKRIEKKDPKLNVWFMYPAIESFAMASLGYLSIFKMLDLDSQLYVERIYSDTKDYESPLECLDCAGFSMSFEIDILTIIKMLKKYQIHYISTYGFDRAQVTVGGINLKEINENLELKKLPNTYVCGEVLDIDGLCGGYNLHFAFASAMFVARKVVQKI